MDVGQDNFRFTLDDPEKKSKAIRHPMSAELHVSSLDRITQLLPAYNFLNQSQTFAQLDHFNMPINTPSTNCTIQTKRALLYGYFNRVGMSEFQINYRVPTIVTGVNDLCQFIIFANNNPATTLYLQLIVPQGYYTPIGLAAYLQAQIQGQAGGVYAAFTVSAPIEQTDTTGTAGTLQSGFVFNTNGSTTWALTYEISLVAVLSLPNQLRAAKFNRLLGAGRSAYGYSASYVPQTCVPQVVFATPSPNWLQTDYIDIVSKSLTNYKETKDTNTNVQAPLGVIGRIYMSDFASLQAATGNNVPNPLVWGTSPIKFTKCWNTVNWSQWSPNQSIDKIDVNLLDMWGDTVFWSSEYPTEWQMTLVATE